MITYDSIQYNDEAVWDLICTGRTFGCFQMESYLVQDWMRKIKPRNIWTLSAVIALIRPGALDSGMAEQYVLNRQNPLAMKSFGHPIIDKIFASTEGVLCIHEDTKIAMGNGDLKPIRHVKRGDIVKSFNNNDKRIYNRECHGCAKTKIGTGYKITLDNGEFVIVTPDHKVMTYDGLKRADALDIKTDCIAFSTYQSRETNHSSHNGCHNAYLLGQLIGDGDISSTGNIISSGTEEKTDILLRWIHTHTPYFARKHFRGRCWYLTLTSEAETGSRRTMLNNWLRDLGIKGTNCYTKFIPNEIYTSSLEEQAAFVAGYLESDGYFGKRMIHLTSVNQNLLDGFGHILRNLGILYTRDPLRIRIVDIKNLMKRIQPYLLWSSYTGKHTLGWRKSVIPVAALENHISSIEPGVSRRNLRKKYQVSLRHKNNFTEHRLYNKFGINTGDVVYYRIKSIEQVLDCTFYDMSVNEYHTLIGNGIVLSNCYQEQLMNLGTDLAWQHIEENARLLKADDLRKAVGKKDQAKILAIGKDFVDGCIVNGVEQAVADQLFEIIKNCGRYLFNLSHSMSYAYRAYQMAWLKHYYPLQFYVCSLNMSHEKQDPEMEVNNLVQDAKSRGITVLPPNINKRNENFVIEDTNKIRFGLGYVKHTGNSLTNFVWGETLTTWAQWLRWTMETSLRSPAIINLIDAGAFSDLGVQRIVLRYVYEFVKELTDREVKTLWEKLTPETDIHQLPDIIQEICDTVTTKRRRQTLSSEIIILRRNLEEKDHPMQIEYAEMRTMGTIVSLSAIAKYEHLSDMNCFELNNLSLGEETKAVNLMCIIDDMIVKTIKTGKNAGKLMASISVHDSSGQMKHLPVFSKVFEESSDIIRKMNPVQIQMEKKERGFFIRGITQINL